MYSLLIANATVVSADGRRRASIAIDGEGRIADIVADGAPIPSAHEVIDAAELLVFPGVIDEHVHFRDPGLTHKADMVSESVAAIAGGVTTVFDMPNTAPQTTTVEAWEAKMRMAAGRMSTNYAFYLGATNDNIDELLRADYSKIPSVKLFMGSSTGGMLVDKEDTLSRLFRNSPALIAAHCEDEALVRLGLEQAKAKYDKIPWRAHPEIRSEEACYRSSALAASLARETGARLHIMHLTTAREIELLGENVTGEACIAHLWFTDEDYDRLGPLIKCNPSVKTEADRAALRKAVASGRISTVATDHAPHTLDEKTSRPYEFTPSGIPMIEHSLPLMLRMADEGHWDYETVARVMAESVADLYGLRERGHIRVGCYADLALVRRERWKVGDVHYKCGWSPVTGEEMSHRVVATVVSGKVVYRDGEVVTEPSGRSVGFDR
ncbi:MAG: amidohydrolase family protein [Bacteroidales bacterium]|nr:amidohydrolase family protein [Bacteroidales bacterium]